MSSGIASDEGVPAEGGTLRYAAGGVGLTVLGVVLSAVLSVPVVLSSIDPVVGFGLAVVLGEAGYAVAAVAFVLLTGRGVDYFDLDPPDGWRLVALVTAGVFLLRTAVVAGALALNIDPSPPSVVNADLPRETLLAILIPASLLVIGPAEELLFRGTVQKYLRERFTAPVAIAVVGVLFTVVHVFALVNLTAAGAAISLGVILVVGLAMGWLYERTGSVLAAMVGHGVYNALIFGSAYLLEGLA